MRRELAVYEAADAVLTVSHKEAMILHDLLGPRALPLVAPDGEAMEMSQVPWAQRRGMLFLGNFRHPPNVEAVAYLCHEVLPRIPTHVRANHPVYVVGNDLDNRVLASAAQVPDMILIGWVPSIRPYLNRSRMLVAPLLHGAGTKRKVIQSLLAGTPVVATSVASEGLPIRGEEHLLIADDADAFALGITRLANDDALSRDLAARGRAAVEPYHSRRAARTMFTGAVDIVLAGPLK
jgi:glycosyltransferase involved in cell wall biosynthesis